MKFLLSNQTRYVYGAHATTTLINDFVNTRLGNYGPGVDEVNVVLVYLPTLGPSTATDGFSDFSKKVLRCPRATFFRAKRRMDILCFVSDVNAETIESHGHLSKTDAVSIASAAAASLDLIRPKFVETDAFDCDTFIADAKKALTEVVDAIEGNLKQE